MARECGFQVLKPPSPPSSVFICVHLWFQPTMRQFHEQLQDLLKTVVSMGNLSESMIEIAVRTFVSRDECQSTRVFELEDEVNRLQVQVDDKAVKLTVLQQPVARDARFLFMASRIGGELE